MSDIAQTLNSAEKRTISKVAALDLGSNSFHLVVARIVARDLQIVHQIKLKVRLADGLDEDDYLAEEAIERGLDSLRLLAESLSDFEPDSVRIVATYTLRKARNANQFIRLARAVLPYPIEVIPGAEEARLIYLGVAHTSHHRGKRLVLDIGGGSTELIIGRNFEPKLMRSLPMGCVTYTHRYFPDGVLKPRAFTRAITAARRELEPVEREFRKLGWKTALGSSGTVRALIDLAAEVRGSSRSEAVDLADLQALTAHCTAAGHVDKLGFSGLSDDRRPIIAAGLAILTAVFESLDIGKLEFSTAALREGVLYDMAERLSDADPRERAAQSLAARYDVDLDQAQRVHDTTMMLYRAVQKDWSIGNKELESLLGWASLLHEVGLQINSRNSHRHSAYILAHVDMPGFNEEQQHLLSTLVGFQRKRIHKNDLTESVLFTRSEISKLIALLRMGVLLNMKRQSNLLPEIHVEAAEGKLTLTFPEGWLQQRQIFQAFLDREQNQVKALGLALSFTDAPAGQPPS